MPTISDTYKLTNENFRSILDYLDRSWRELQVVEAIDSYLDIILDWIRYRIWEINFNISIENKEQIKNLLSWDTKFMIHNFVWIILTVKQLKKLYQ